MIGRSNAGKSTLLNALLGSRDLTFVPVSRHPGKTRHLDFYAAGLSAVRGAGASGATHTAPRLGAASSAAGSGSSSSSPPSSSPSPPLRGSHLPELVLVDTPGYGFARGRGWSSQAEWQRLLGLYLSTRRAPTLERVLVLLDARQGLTPIDEEALSALEEAAAPYHVILTKADALSRGALEAQALSVASALSKRGLPFPILNAASALTGAGMKELMETLVFTARLHRRASLSDVR